MKYLSYTLFLVSIYKKGKEFREGHEGITWKNQAYREVLNKQTEKPGWLPGVEGRRKRELPLNGYRVSVGEDEESFKKCSGDGYTTMWMCLMSLNFTVKNE